ncbi:hypothetical protein [Nocardia sp. NPDC050710]|uniref:dTMP kinase n=1 Tax=Nocardia sp. NPDC050710 TaxID=3157220 RepID=UPI003406037C
MNPESRTNQHRIDRGRLISLDGLNGVGKTYLTRRVLAAFPEAERPLLLDEFSQRREPGSDSADLGRRLLRILADAAKGEHFLRGGFPKSETLLLLAIKMHDLETTLPDLLAGRTVIEGRSALSTAVYQSLIMHPADDDAAADTIQTILAMAAAWRPLPDLTIVLVDDLDAAIRRAEGRDGVEFAPDQWEIHRRAAPLFERLADLDPEHVRLLDRRDHDTDSLTAMIGELIRGAPAREWRTLLNPAGP